MNRGITVLQTVALPLGYGTVCGRAGFLSKKTERLTGCGSPVETFQGAALKSTDRAGRRELEPARLEKPKKMERLTGLEPATSTLARWRSTR